MKLEELLKSATPCPWKFGYGSHFASPSDAQLALHAVNVLPELVEAAQELTIALARHSKPVQREQEIQAAWERTNAALAAADEVKI